MKLSLDRLARIPRAFALAGLAAAAATLGATDASAQRNRTGDVWQSTASRGFRPAPQETCRPIDSRIPRGYRGGHYETRYERVWIPGELRRIWVPPVYEWRYDSCGRRIRVICQEGFYRTERAPGRYHTEARRVWVPARATHVGSRRGRSHRVTHRGGRYRG